MQLEEGPTNDKQRAYSIWIYVKDHYHNFDESNQPMKHVFTHGSQDSVYDMDNKSVGLWLHSFINNIRFVVPTLKIATSCDNPDSEENENL